MKELRITPLVAFFTMASVILLGCADKQKSVPETVGLSLTFEKGAVAEVWIIDTKIFDEPEPSWQSTWKAELEVIDANPGKPILSWTLKSVEVRDELHDKSKPQDEEIFLDIPVQFVANAKGQPQALRNREAVLKNLQENAELPKFKQSPWNDMMPMFEFMSDAVLLAIFSETLDIMSICQGTEMKVGEILEYQEAFENSDSAIVRLGGQIAHMGKLKSNISYSYFDKLDFPDGSNIALIGYKSEIDVESQKALYRERARKYDIPPVSDTELDADLYKSNETADCQVNSETGWVRQMSYFNQLEASGKTENRSFFASLKWK